jgi:hypothetical protein
MGWPVRGSGSSGRKSGAFRFGIARLAFVVVILLTLSGTVGWRPTPAAAASSAVVATDVLNVREEAGTWGTILAELVWGEWVDILDGPTSDNWYYVAYWGGNGWVLGDYLSFDGTGGWDSGDTGVRFSAWVNTDALNVRNGASSDSEVVDLVWYGDELTVVGPSVGGYTPISHWGEVAWVWEGYLRYDAPPGPEHWIDVDRSSQRVNLYEGGNLIQTFWGSFGWDLSDDGFYATANGTFYVYAKERDLTWTPYGGVYFTNWIAFDPARDNGFHSYSMDASGDVVPGGWNPTGGCIALEPWAAAYLFDFAPIGTRVEIHW